MAPRSQAASQYAEQLLRRDTSISFRRNRVIGCSPWQKNTAG